MWRSCGRHGLPHGMQLIAKTSELLLVLLADFVVLRFQLEELLVEESIFVHLRSN